MAPSTRSATESAYHIDQTFPGGLMLSLNQLAPATLGQPPRLGLAVRPMSEDASSTLDADIELQDIGMSNDTVPTILSER
jgi:hypothetical protein